MTEIALSKILFVKNIYKKFPIKIIESEFNTKKKNDLNGSTRKPHVNKEI